MARRARQTLTAAAYALSGAAAALLVWGAVEAQTVERARLEERLTVVVDADDAARAVRVPPLLLQPLVENAVKHGAAPPGATSGSCRAPRAVAVSGVR